MMSSSQEVIQFLNPSEFKLFGKKTNGKVILRLDYEKREVYVNQEKFRHSKVKLIPGTHDDILQADGFKLVISKTEDSYRSFTTAIRTFLSQTSNENVKNCANKTNQTPPKPKLSPVSKVNAPPPSIARMRASSATAPQPARPSEGPLRTIEIPLADSRPQTGSKSVTVSREIITRQSNIAHFDSTNIMKNTYSSIGVDTSNDTDEVEHVINRLDAQQPQHIVPHGKQRKLPLRSSRPNSSLHTSPHTQQVQNLVGKSPFHVSYSDKIISDDQSKMSRLKPSELSLKPSIPTSSPGVHNPLHLRNNDIKVKVDISASVAPTGHDGRTSLPAPNKLNPGKHNLTGTRGTGISSFLTKGVLNTVGVVYKTFRQQLNGSSSSNLLPSALSSLDVASRREGMRNLGNTCYMNSVMQSLTGLDEFCDDLVSVFWTTLCTVVIPNSNEDTYISNSTTSRVTINDGEALVPESASSSSVYSQSVLLLQAVRSLSTSSRGVIDMTAMKKAVDSTSSRFRGNSEQDAHEFLTDLLSELHEEMTRRLRVFILRTARLNGVELGRLETGTDGSTVTSSSAVKNFEMHQRSKRLSILREELSVPLPPSLLALLPTLCHLHACVTINMACTCCGHKKEPKHEYYRDFSLDLPPNTSAEPTATASSSYSHKENIPTLTLESLLTSFFAEEQRELVCDVCNTAGANVKIESKISLLPRVLILHIKRFEYNRTTNKFNKLISKVKFSKTLDMSSHVSLAEPTEPKDDCHPIITDKAAGEGPCLYPRRIDILSKHCNAVDLSTEILEMSAALNQQERAQSEEMGYLSYAEEINLETVGNADDQAQVGNMNDNIVTNNKCWKSLNDIEDIGICNNGVSADSYSIANVNNSKGVWDCPECTYTNKFSNSRCVMCNKSCSAAAPTSVKEALNAPQATRTPSKRPFDSGLLDLSNGDYGHASEGRSETKIVISPSFKLKRNKLDYSFKAYADIMDSDGAVSIDRLQSNCVSTPHVSPVAAFFHETERNASNAMKNQVTRLRIDSIGVGVKDEPNGKSIDERNARDVPRNDSISTSAFKHGNTGNQIDMGNETETGTLFLHPLTSKPDCQYQLNAVIRHHGRNSFAGHYTCDVLRLPACGSSHSKNTTESSTANHGDSHRGIYYNLGCVQERIWHRCNDSIVSVISEDNVLDEQDSAYILMYVRKSNQDR